MKKKRGSLPTLFCEWVVGTTIPAALGPIPKKPSPKRDIVSVEVVTDDETEEDTLRITYPRSGRSRDNTSSKDVIVKRVRFEDGPAKSALKNGSTAAASNEASTDSGAEASAESSDSEATPPEPPPTPKKESKRAKKKAQKEKEPADSSKNEVDSNTHPQESEAAQNGNGKKEEQPSTDAVDNADGKKEEQPSTDAVNDADPHPTCECLSCVDGRKKQQCKKKCKAPEPKADENKPQVQPEGASKDEAPAQEPGNAADDSSNKDKDKQNGEKQEDSAKNGEAKPEGDDKGQEPSQQAQTEEKESQKESDKSAKDPAQNNVYPPHPRFIEPIRAEVLHMEKVMEAPEDPIPNAYYDAESKVVRVYYGPMYGHHGQMLYPRHDPSYRPMPMGMHYPYHHGFHPGPGPDKHDLQGMPTAGWNPYYPSAGGFPAAYPGYIPSGPPPWPVANPQAGNDKGAFSKFGAPVPPAVPTSSKDQDVAGADNVFPPTTKPNPYIPKRSQFSGFGSNNNNNGNRNGNNAGKVASDGNPGSRSKKNDGNSNCNTNSGKSGQQSGSRSKQSQRGQSAAQDTTSGWGNNSQEGSNNGNNTWANGETGSNNGNNTWGNGGSGSNNGNDTWGNGRSGSNNGNDTWGNGGTGSNNGNDTWGHGGTGSNNEQSSWDNNDTATNTGQGEWANGTNTASGNDNNVMPGAWTGSPSGAGSSWQDPTMAASTNGRVDKVDSPIVDW